MVAPLPDTPILETARLVLRPLQLGDAPAAQRHFAHWEIVRWLNGGVPWPYPANGAATHIQRCQAQRARGERFFWAICLKTAPAELVGGIDLWPDTGSQDQRGFWIAAELQGRGLMTEGRGEGHRIRLSGTGLAPSLADERRGQCRLASCQGATGRAPRREGSETVCFRREHCRDLAADERGVESAPGRLTGGTEHQSVGIDP